MQQGRRLDSDENAALVNRELCDTVSKSKSIVSHAWGLRSNLSAVEYDLKEI